MSMDDRHGEAKPDSYAPESYEDGYRLGDQKNTACSSSGNSQILSAHPDMSLLESDLYQSKDAGKSIDPRLLMLLEYFRELYVRKGDLFRKTFPGIHDEFVDVFKRIGQVSSQAKSSNQTGAVRSMQRSLSVGSPRTRSRSVEDNESPLRLDRFKIRTVVLDGADQGGGPGGGQQGDTKSGSSK